MNLFIFLQFFMLSVVIMLLGFSWLDYRKSKADYKKLKGITEDLRD